MFISNSGLRKAKFRSTADNSLGVSSLAPFSVFKVDGGENLVPEPKIVDVSFVSNYDTLEIEEGVIYGSKVKANLIDIHKIIIESEQEIQLTDCIGVWGITDYGTRYDHIGYISDNLEYIDFITPNKIDITKLFLDVLLRGIKINPIETCFYLRTSIDDDQTIYEITQMFTGRTPLGDPITVDVNDENVNINYNDLLSEGFTENVSIDDNITTFVDLSKECDIIYDGEITDTLVLGAYMKSDNVIGLLDNINESISSGYITYNDNIITISEGAMGAPAGTEGFYCIFNANLSDDGTALTSVNLVPTQYKIQETLINENPYYFETEGEHEVEFEYVNKFYPDLVYPRNNNNYFENSCIIELNDNFYDYWLNFYSLGINEQEKIEKITLSNNVSEDIVERYISYLKWYSNLKEININTDKYITINNCVINKTDWSLAGYFGTDVVVPGLVKSIGSIFYNNSNLKTVVLPNGITSIGNYAFRYCSNLTSVTIGTGVTSIGNYAFHDCSSLTSVNIPDSVTSIRQYTFSGCSNLTSVTIGTGVTSIENYAFNGCTGLTKVNIENIESFCKISFGTNTSALPLYFGKNLYINDQLVTDLNIPDTITTLPGGIFYNCESIQKVTLPSTLTNIGSSTFRSCINLSEITCNAMTAPTISASTFRDVKSGGVLKVPTGATGYDAWLSTSDYYLGKYGWTIEYI